MYKPILVISLLLTSVLCVTACSNNQLLHNPATTTGVTSPFIQSLTPGSISNPTGASPMTPTQNQTPGASSASTPPASIPTSWNGIPILYGVISGNEGKGKYMYVIQSTVETVQGYYEQTMPKLGWQKMETAVGQDGGAQLMYYKDGRIVSILLTQDGEKVIVMLSLE